MSESRIKYLPLFIQVVGILLVLAIYRLESQSFSLASGLFLVGALVSWLLPERYRLPAMIATSLGGIFLLFQPSVAGLILAIAISIIFVCRSRLHWAIQTAILLAIGTALLMWRHQSPQNQWAAAVVPVIGTIFMLRTVYYLREVAKNQVLPGWRETLAFFFILPNYVMWFFPLIDYKIFSDNSAKPREARVLRVGMDWVFDGIVHLIVYRVLQVYFYLPLEHVNTRQAFFAFLFLNYLNYVRISGVFHLVVGTICLYGVELPRTHFFYLFASNMLDLGNRINIYWKEFMRSNFFRPILESFRKWNAPTWLGLSVALTITMTATSLIHPYVYLWSHGKFIFRFEDFLFWGLGYLGGLVGFFLYKKRKQNRSVIEAFWTDWWSITLCLLFLSFMWAIWTSPSVEDLVATAILASGGGLADLTTLAIFPGVGLAGAIFNFRRRRHAKEAQLNAAVGTGSAWRMRDFMNLAGLAVFVILSLPFVAKLLQPDQRQKLQGVLSPDFETEFGFQARKTSYYDGLKNDNAQESVDEDERPIDESSLFQSVPDYRRRIIRPNADVMMKGHRVITNRWGMVDERDYTLEKPHGKLRIAIMSASNSMPHGIPQGKEWPRVLENELRKLGYDQLEFLNFSVIGFSTFLAPLHFTETVAPFKPDVLIGAGCARELWINGFNISTALREGLEIPYGDEVLPFLKVGRLDGFLARHYLRTPSREVQWAGVDWGIQKITQEARSRNTDLVYLITPYRALMSPEEEEGVRWDEIRMIQIFDKLGWKTSDLSQILKNESLQDVTLVDDLTYFNHLNVRGHEMVARQFLPKFVEYLNARGIRPNARVK